MDARAKTRRDTLRNLQKGAVEPTPTVKRILEEFEKHGIATDGKPTFAAYALLKLLQNRSAP